MVSYLQIEKLTKSFGDKILFTDVTFGIYQGDKIGIIAANGTGKSTFLNIIAEKEDYDEGKITGRRDLTIGYLEQTPEVDPNQTPKEYIESNVKIGSEDMSAIDSSMKFLTQFRIKDVDRKFAEMSGGQIKRVVLAKILADSPSLLILDEPTNHLDIEMVEWLEDYLSRQNITLLMVTHDRYFLDKVCNKIIEIDRQNFFYYEGNYDYYLEKREERYEVLNSELTKIKNLLRKELDWIRRQPQARGSKAKYRIDNYYQLEEKSKLNLHSKELKLSQGKNYIGSKIFEAKNVSKSFGNKKILENWNYTFSRYEKLGIVGENGVGKSTFIKLLLGELKTDSGYFDIGTTVKWGYYSQEGISVLDEKKKVIDAIREIAEEVKIGENTKISASQFLTRFLFSPESQQKYIHKLSGGEKRRLYLATVLMKNPNFLILDEPTNDLDIVTLTVLEDYLVNFNGCVIIISHDRFFLDRIVDHIFIFKGNGEIKDFPGNYSAYRESEKILSEQRKREGTEKKNKDNINTVAQTIKRKKPGLSYKEKREMESLTSILENLESEKKELEAQMLIGGTDHLKLQEKATRLQIVMAEIDVNELRLLELMDKENQ